MQIIQSDPALFVLVYERKKERKKEKSIDSYYIFCYNFYEHLYLCKDVQ